MTTVTAVKRALEEVRDQRFYNDRRALHHIINSPTLLTMIADRLSDRGTAGNAAARSNLIVLEAIKGSPGLSKIANDALEWAIDQLTPPQPASQG